MISNISFSLPGYIGKNRKTNNVSLPNNEKSSGLDHFISSNKLKNSNKISFGKLTSIEGFKEVGKIKLIDPATKNDVKAVIKSKFTLEENSKKVLQEEYCVVLGEEILGYMRLQHKDEPYKISENLVKEGYMRVSHIDTKKDYENNIYRGVGMGLIYKLIERALETYDGRIGLYAFQFVGMKSPVKLYRHLGFIRNKCEMQGVNMLLPEEGILKWQEIVEEVRALTKADSEPDNVLPIPILFSVLKGRFLG